MSTFGKKALNWWDYNTFDIVMWNGTPKHIQMEILKKWFPIGMKCHKALKDYSTGVFEVDYSRTLEILGYQEQLWGWVLKIQAHDLFIYEKSPMLVVPTLEDIRDRKLTRIL